MINTKEGVDRARASFVSWLDEMGVRLERRAGLLGAAVVVGLVLTVAGAIYVTPSPRPVNHGVFYAQMSENPFVLRPGVPVQMRVLAPLIGYFTFLRGPIYILFPLLMCSAFFAAVYWHVRRQGFGAAAATGAGALMAFSTPLLHQLHFAGYSDGLSFLLLFLCLVYIERPMVWGPLFALALLTHEANLLLAPVMVVFYARGKFDVRRWVVAGVVVVVSMLPVIAYRSYVQRHVTVGYSTGFYLTLTGMKHNFHLIALLAPLGVFMAFKLFWVIPAAAGVRAWRGRRWDRVALVATPVACALAQLLVASDTSRLVGFAFASIVWGAMMMREAFASEAVFSKWLWILIVANLFVPQYNVSYEAIPLVPTPVSVVLEFLGVRAFSFEWK